MCFWTYLPWFLKSTILKKGSIIWKNEHNFSIICPQKEQSYWHNMLLFLAQSMKAYFRDPIIQNLPGEHAPQTPLSSLLLRRSLPLPPPPPNKPNLPGTALGTKPEQYRVIIISWKRLWSDRKAYFTQLDVNSGYSKARQQRQK